MNHLRLAILLVLFSPCLLAQQQLTHIPRPKENSLPGDFFKYGTKTLFTAYTAQTGRELWITDGTEGGTFLLKDFTEGVLSTRIFNFVIFKNEVYFIATGLLNQQLWKTNGTSAGTVQVSDNIFKVVYDNMTATDKFIFFFRIGPVGIQLWRSDGTTAGTVLADPNLSLYEPPINVTAGGDALFFTARSSSDPSATSGRIWTSNGTLDGTKSIGPPIASGESHNFDQLANHPRSLLFYKGALYFLGLGSFGGVAEIGLMKSELTGGDPINIKGILKENVNNYDYVDFVQGTVASDKLYIQLFQSYSNRLTIVESDGTAVGTSVIYQKSFSKYFSVSELLVDGSNVYFTSGNDQGGIALIKLDLKSKVALEIKQLSSGAVSPSLDIQGRQIPGFIRKNAGGKIIVYAIESDFKASLWSSDGTATNTIKMTTPDIYLYYRPTETMLSGISDNQVELWSYDGTSTSGKLVKDVEPGVRPLRTGPILSINNQALAIFDESTVSAQTITPWLTDGSPSGTHPMTGFTPGALKYSYHLQHWGDRAAFIASNNYVKHLYGWDSNSLDDLYQYENINGDDQPLAVKTNDQSLFFADQMEETVRLLKVVKGSKTPEVIMTFGGNPQPTTHIGWLTGSEQYVYFFVTSGNNSGVWRSDGTSQGTTKLYDCPIYLRSIILWHDKIFAFSGNVIYASDEQTKRLVPIVNAPAFSYPLFNTDNLPLKPLDNGLLFLGDTDDEGAEIWTTDGTASGTRILKSIGAGQLSGGAVGAYINYNNKIYFSAVDAEHGAELWVTDGTAQNTKLLKDIAPGKASSIPLWFFIHKDKILFTAWTPDYGTELWSTDGTANGTGLYADITPGPVGSLPFAPCSLNDQLIFFADAGVEGEQLFSYTPPILAVEHQRENLKAYPNPTDGFVHIEAPGTGRKSIELATIDGRRLLTFDQSEAQIDIDMRQHPDGVYILKVAHEGRIDVVKIVKR